MRGAAVLAITNFNSSGIKRVHSVLDHFTGRLHFTEQTLVYQLSEMGSMLIFSCYFVWILLLKSLHLVLNHILGNLKTAP